MLEGADPTTNLPLRLRARDVTARPRGDGEAYVFAIFLLALASRVFTVLHQAPTFLGPGVMFDQLGLRIAAGLGFGPTAIVPPIYPYYLGLLYRVYGYNHHAVVLSHALIGALITVAVAALIRSLGLGRRYALLGGLLYALSPQSMAQARHLSPQLLVVLFFTMCALLWIRTRPLPSWGDVIWAGLMAGLCVLTRSGMVLPCLVLLLARGWIGSSTALGGLRPAWFRRSIALRRVLVVAAMALVVMPWVVRNSLLHERAVWVESTWALRVRAVTIPGEQSLEYQVPGRSVVAPDNVRLTDNALALGDVVGFYITEPAQVLRVWGLRLRAFLGFSGWNDSVTMGRFPYEGLWYRVAHALFYGVVMTFLLAWLVLLGARGTRERVLAAGVLGILALTVIAGGTGDARLAALPLLIPLAMRGAWGFLVLGEVRLRDPRPMPGAGSEEARADMPQEPDPTLGVLGLAAPSRSRWLLWIGLAAALWMHGVWMAL